MVEKRTLKERLDLAALDADAALKQLLEGDLDLLKLANVSVEKMLRNADKSVKLAEGSTTCTNQSSTDIKKVLLSMTLQRSLGIRFTPEYSASLETITQLADALYDARGKKEFAR